MASAAKTTAKTATPVGSQDTTPLLSVQGLAKAYSGRRVVDGVSIHVGAGEIVGLLGPNGAGKTTSFNMTVGLVRPDAGSVQFRGIDITRLPMHRRARLGIGYLTQEPSVFRKLTVEQNILAILETCEGSASERQSRLAYLLDELDLARLAKSYAYQLSGGEKRRLEITRALVTSPDCCCSTNRSPASTRSRSMRSRRSCDVCVTAGWASSSLITMSGKPSDWWTEPM